MAEKPAKSVKKVTKKEAPKKVVEKKKTTEKKVVKELAQEEVIEKTATEPTAKAGKRSAKSLKEREELQKKEERKAEKTVETADEKKPKTIKTPTRSRLERRAKKYRELAKLIDKEKKYSVAQALELAIKTSPVKFDASVEMHVNLNVDPRQADQNIRDTVVLPNGTGKTVRVAVIGDPDIASSAKKAGADIVGGEDLFATFDKGEFKFDVLISTPSFMPRLGKYAKVLGPKGLMPNPKSGTVTNDVAKAVEQSKAGRVEYRVDSTGIVHLPFGKVSFGPQKLTQNANAVLGNLTSNKPSGIKGAFVKSIFFTTSMGPSIPVEQAPQEES
jgi:large subunit ribosomal protein L1